jgi:tetratricopeptide (TPR) repeat protein
MQRVAIAGVMVAFAGGGLIFLIRSAPRARTPLDPEQTLNRAIELLREYRLDEAEPLLDAYLREYPDGVNGHLLMAQLALERAERRDPPDAAQSRRALDHLARIPTRSLAVPVGSGLRDLSAEARERALSALVKLYEGKARSHLAQPAAAESAWSEALRLDPGLAEAAWLLVDLYAHEGREAEARRLGLRLAEAEPQVVQRVEWLLSLAWLDVARVAPQRVIRRFEPAVRLRPTDRHAAIALGLALVRERRVAEGLDILRRTVDAAPDAPDALAALLTGLSESQQADALAEAVEHVPPAWAATTPFAEHLGRVALARRDWSAAAASLRRAWEAQPHRIDLTEQLARALRLNGEDAAADRLDARIKKLRRHRDELLGMYRRLLGHPDPDLREVRDVLKFAGGASAAARALIALHDPAPWRRFAELCQELGFPDQARAWRRALVELDPGSRDPSSEKPS